ncbi:hypothetical protein ECTPHS_10229 [Ectothiorhodospira sp. PHS-1]|uniref:tetratricopeptide repeat protein n=1 Tax=Ectothiorhodospira sp. PHS-1 TaxID=519989 RepID=UPI00024A89E5|nr:LicD family protein [Ectothiorhodospira sp. PHS-1]EHQ53057.1 hypothetical protein ECTPHS_10229 [Ectothiorhodospira sp. PHS-1]
MVEPAALAKHAKTLGYLPRAWITLQRWLSVSPGYLERLLLQGQHATLQNLCQEVLRHDKGRAPSLSGRQALHYWAKSHYYLGEWEKAEELLDRLLFAAPWHADTRYLAADNARLAGRMGTAWQHLIDLSTRSRRLKTWLYMAELVNSTDDWHRMRAHYDHAIRQRAIRSCHPCLDEHVAKGAQRGGDYTTAKAYWRQILACTRSGSGRLKPIYHSRRHRFSVALAGQALEDIQSVLAKADIPMFLISGTLLGCMREGNFIGHDHDIDIGVWDDVPLDRLITAITRAGRFHILPRRHSGCLRIKHLTGIAIDLFIHYRESESVWHGGVKVRWHNTPFTLRDQTFLGRRYWIPADHETYLTENYGQWRRPQRGFDSTLDTPNAEILCEQELALHAYQKYHRALIGRCPADIERYGKLLASLREPLS